MRLKRYRAVVINKLLSIAMKAGKVEVKKMAVCLAIPFSENLEDVAALGLTRVSCWCRRWEKLADH